LDAGVQIVNVIDSINLEHDDRPENRFTFFGIRLRNGGRE
jgi:hypothetical protein